MDPASWRGHRSNPRGRHGDIGSALAGKVDSRGSGLNECRSRLSDVRGPLSEKPTSQPELARTVHPRLHWLTPSERLYLSNAMIGSAQNRFPDRLRGTALIAALAGGACSFGLMLRAGQRQQSRVLLFLFAIWTLSPFMITAWANIVSKRWSVVARVTLYVTTLILTLSSLAIYGGVTFGHLRAKVGFVFLVVPFASWLLISAVSAPALISRSLSNKRVSRGSG